MHSADQASLVSLPAPQTELTKALEGSAPETDCNMRPQGLCFLPQAKMLSRTPSLLRHSPPVTASTASKPALRSTASLGTTHSNRPLRSVCTAALSASSPAEPAVHAEPAAYTGLERPVAHAERAVHAGQQEGSAEQFLLKECGIEESKVDGIIRAAVAWRVTPGGRQLIDRRRRSRIERNMLQCAGYLITECGIEPGESVPCSSKQCVLIVSCA